MAQNRYAFRSPSTGLFSYAVAALEQIEDRTSHPQMPHQHEALIAVLFSALTVEAFINEVGDYAAYYTGRYPGTEPRSIEQLGAILQELKEQRTGGSIEAKYVMAKWILDGAPYNRGAEPFQRFHLLIELRNTLVHVTGLDLYEITSDGPVFRETPRIIKRLETEHILADETDPAAPSSLRSWVERLATLAVARWACIATSCMIHSLAAVMPNTSFGGFWRGMYDSYYHIPGGPPRFS